MSRTGWDSITVDLQHGVQDYMSMVACLQGIAASAATPLVRVPENSAGIIGKVLDAGAWGVICPMINTPDEARSLVRSCLYPPKGARSNGPNRASAYSDSAPYQSFANDEVLIIPMMEAAEAVDNLEAILDVPGVSGVYIGPSDLGFSLGLGPAFDRSEPKILEIYERVVEATGKRGQFAGIHTLSAAYAVRMRDMGFRLMTIGSDAFFMSQAAKLAADAFDAAAPTARAGQNTPPASSQPASAPAAPASSNNVYP